MDNKFLNLSDKLMRKILDIMTKIKYMILNHLENFSLNSAKTNHYIYTNKTVLKKYFRHLNKNKNKKFSW